MTTVLEDASALRVLRVASDEAEQRAKEAKRTYEIAQRKLYERMDGENCQSVKVDDVNFVRQHTTFAVMQDREAFLAWAADYDESLVESRERKALLNELVREAIDNGDELPPGLGFTVKEYISQRVAS